MQGEQGAARGLRPCLKESRPRPNQLCAASRPSTRPWLPLAALVMMATGVVSCRARQAPVQVLARLQVAHLRPPPSSSSSISAGAVLTHGALICMQPQRICPWVWDELWAVGARACPASRLRPQYGSMAVGTLSPVASQRRPSRSPAPAHQGGHVCKAPGDTFEAAHACTKLPRHAQSPQMPQQIEGLGHC